MVDDLRKLLAAADLRPPYLLVGASSGGLNARLFAYTHPEEVVGLVLVDPSHEDQTEGYRKLDPRGLSPEEWDAQVIEPGLSLRRECIVAAESGMEPESEMYRRCSFAQYPQLSAAVQKATIAFQMAPKFQRAQLSEEENVFRATVRQLKAARRSLGAMPIVVLAHDRPPLPTDPVSSDKIALRNARHDLWLALSRSSAAISEIGEVRVVPGSGHGISLEKPEAVITAVRELILASRTTSRG
jgi:pimeloyl-ACP methyl ester carboxylesterase